ncbi:hypothetical protein LCGC14_1963890 [marine sediment metagenome]|uniref:Uncharacterized protein n=1 Tax=marine sediment metagenome TaxID=412755 RepID=A0A0F9FE45_9ZZZZ
MKQELLDELLQKWSEDIPILLAGRDAIRAIPGKREKVRYYNPLYKEIHLRMDNFQMDWLESEMRRTGTDRCAIVRRCIDRCRNPASA